ncbi:lipase family protein [Marinobacter sp. CHS3-4]|uniref:lipase family protein n=1 Tax=Marinobacter sp. CHS3-4 TaxID=3045174 RepID=UPI0024B539D6|nr:lipase family protein [Marinobacter sp. CHS3-4]MDI9246928.1 lipase family protein [Marinobacter sp. CHS3-4]
MEAYFNSPVILRRPPIKRAAYSDRTAWIMAEICRLVYEPLPPEMTVEQLANDLRASVAEGDSDSDLLALVRRAIDAQTGYSEKFTELLKEAGLTLIDAFAVNGTEGVLIKLNETGAFEGMLVLAFRGTQPSIIDVATDLKANLVQAPDGGQIHAGFLGAFEQVKTRIQVTLDKHAGVPLYLTGHSLGGALAMVATRYLGSDSTGATYTFGCPRVADDAFYRDIKTPVYRVVNGADAVARVPFGYGFSIFLCAIRLIPINFTFEISEWLRRQFFGYTHYGNLVFLAPPKVDRTTGNAIEDPSAIVKIGPNIFWRAKTVFRRWVATRGKAAASDHSMSQYALKLQKYAEHRN